MSLKRADSNNIDFGELQVAGAPAINSFAYPAGRSSINLNEPTRVRVFGSNFVLGCTVRVGDDVASVVSYINSTELSFEAPFLPVGSYRLMVVNPDGQYAVKLPGLIYTDYAVWITPAGLLGNINESLNEFQLQSTGQTYSIYDGFLPPGYTLSASGKISGTLTVTPVVNQTWNFVVATVDQYGATSTRSFTIRFSSTPVTWITAGDDLPSFSEAPYIQGIQAVSNSTVTYTVINGALPGGFQLGSNNGIISGTADSITRSLSANTVFTFVIRATDQELQFADQQFTLTYTPTSPVWTTFAYVQGYRAGETVNLTYNAYSNSTVTYSVSSGILPVGTTLDSSTGLLTGIVQAVDLQTTYNFTVRATDQEGHSATITSSLTVFAFPMAATGGTVTTGRNTNIHTFNTSGTFTVTSSPPNSFATVIIVAGGGGGGAGNGGGGGAGGFIYLGALNIPVGTYNITVGTGGAGATAMGAGAPYGGDGVQRPGSQGTNTSAFGYTAYGGGGGAAGYGKGSQSAISGLAAGQGQTGGSGGGAGAAGTVIIKYFTS